jgi:hypothetical protein
MKKSKAARGLITYTIHYRDRRYTDSRDHTLKVDVRCDEVIEEQYAAAMVAARTGVPWQQVQIVKVTQP